MSSTLPTGVRALLGLAAIALEEVRKIPETLPTVAATVPVGAISTAMQASLKFQQQVAVLASRGDEVISQFRGAPEEPPAWATFDDDEASDAQARPLAAFERVDYEPLSEDVSPAAPTASTAAKKAPAKKTAAKKAPAKATPLKATPPVKAAPAKTAPAKAAPAKKLAPRKKAAPTVGTSGPTPALASTPAGPATLPSTPAGPATPPPPDGPAVAAAASGPAVGGVSSGPATPAGADDE